LVVRPAHRKEGGPATEALKEWTEASDVHPTRAGRSGSRSGSPVAHGRNSEFRKSQMPPLPGRSASPNRSPGRDVKKRAPSPPKETALKYAEETSNALTPSERLVLLEGLFCAFDLDLSGSVSSVELKKLGEERRKMGQKAGEWTEVRSQE
jgi:hypothetical protein